MKRIVIAGTGTDVGKTFVSTQLLRSLRNKSVNAIGLKPIESGFGPEWASDAGALYAASGAPQGVEWRPRYALPEPLSPHLAARNSGVGIEARTAARWFHDNTIDNSAPTVTPQIEVALCETAGGLFTPLSVKETNLDIVCALEPCLWVLIAKNRLGVLHDVGATVRAAQTEHRAPDAIYLNTIEEDQSTESNAIELRRVNPGLAVLEELSALENLIGAS